MINLMREDEGERRRKQTLFTPLIGAGLPWHRRAAGIYVPLIGLA